MRYVITLLLSVGIAASMPNSAKIDVDHGTMSAKGGGGGVKYTPMPAAVIYQDSANNQYSFWTDIQDPVAAHNDTVVFVFRRFDLNGSGYIGMVWRVAGESAWMVDHGMNGQWTNDPNGEAYLGRYPNAVYHPQFPTATWAELAPGPAWGAIGIANELDYGVTGQFYGVYSGNIQVHKSIAKYVSDENSPYYGKIFGMAYDANEQGYYYVYDPESYEFVVEPTLVPAVADAGGLVAFDYNGSRVAWFGGNFVVAYSDDYGTNWDIIPMALDSIPVEVYGEDTLDSPFWQDGLLLNDGTPVMITDITSGATYSSYGYVARTIWFVTPDFASQIVPYDPNVIVYYPQLAIERNTGTLYALWMQAAPEYIVYEDSIVGVGWFDVYASRSTDGGHTWDTPINITNTPDVNEGLLQVAREVSPEGNIYFAVGRARGQNSGVQPAPMDTLDLLWDVVARDGICDMYVDLMMYNYPPAVEEGGIGNNALLKIVGNKVAFSLPRTGRVNINVYDASGRVVKSIAREFNAGEHTITIDGLNSGVYIVRAEGSGLSASGKLIVLH